MIAAVGLAAASFILIAAAVILVAGLLLVSARRRPGAVGLPEPTGMAPRPETARHPGDALTGAPVGLIASHGRLVRERDEVERRLADLRMAHRAQAARLADAAAVIGRGASVALRLDRDRGVGEGIAARDREIIRLRAVLSDAEGRLLAASSSGLVGRAGPSPGSLVPSKADGAGGGPAAILAHPERTMARPSRHKLPKHLPDAGAEPA